MANPQHILAGALLASIGFELVGQNSILPRLNQAVPSGGTAMRDSMLAGIGLILKLNSALGQLGVSTMCNFVHIVITDGQDTSSKASLEDTAAAFYTVGKTIPISRCRTIIIGIDLGQDEKTTKELVALRILGGENCELYDIGSVQMSDLFNRIQVNLGIIRQTGMAVVHTSSGQRAVMMATRDQAVAQVSRTSFAVVFNIDISGSMQGSRFGQVKKSIAEFLSRTPPDDLVAAICFNNQVSLLGQQAQPPPKAPARVAPAPAARYTRPVPAKRYTPVAKSHSCCSLL